MENTNYYIGMCCNFLPFRQIISFRSLRVSIEEMSMIVELTQSTVTSETHEWY